MKPKSMLLLVVAGTCGLIAAVAVTQRLTGTEPAAAPVEARKKVVVAKSDQEQGVQLKSDMLQIIELATTLVPEGAFSEPAELTGQTLRFPIFKGEPILAAKLGGEKTLKFLTDGLAPGMTVASVTIKEDGGLRGLINPGNRVDVLWLPGRPDLHGASVIPLLQNVKVVAVGQRIDATESESSRQSNAASENYTLLVTDQQNLRLACATGKGTLRLKLRGKDDTSLKPVDDEALDIMLGLKQGAKEKATEPDRSNDEPELYEVSIISGGKLSVETIDVSEQNKRLRTRN